MGEQVRSSGGNGAADDHTEVWSEPCSGREDTRPEMVMKGKPFLHASGKIFEDGLIYYLHFYYYCIFGPLVSGIPKWWG